MKMSIKVGAVMKVNVEKIYSVVFFISYFFLLLYSILGENNNIHNLLSNLSTISLLLVFVTVILQARKIKTKDMMALFLITILGFAFSFLTKDFLFIKFALILFVTKNIVFEKRIKVDVIIRIIIFILSFILYNIGIIKDTINYTSSGLIRHSYGFSNPNVIALHVLILIFEMIYLNRHNKRIVYFVTVMLAFWVYKISLSRTALIGYVVFMILNFLYIHNEKILENRILKKCIIYMPVISVVMMVLFYNTYISGSKFGVMINDILSGRLANIYYYINTFDLTLLGNRFGLVADRTIDNVPVYFLYSFGIIGFLLYEIGFIKLQKKLYLNKEYTLVLIFLIFVIYGLSERLWIYIDYNIFMSAFTLIFFESEVKNVDKK